MIFYGESVEVREKKLQIDETAMFLIFSCCQIKLPSLNAIFKDFLWKKFSLIEHDFFYPESKGYLNVIKCSYVTEKGYIREKWFSWWHTPDYIGFSNRDLTTSMVYCERILEAIFELSMSKHSINTTFSSWWNTRTNNVYK